MDKYIEIDKLYLLTMQKTLNIKCDNLAQCEKINLRLHENNEKC